MKNRIYNFGFLLTIVLFSCSKEVITDTGFGIIKGRVVKELTFEPLSNAKISTNPATSSVITDEDGNFVLSNIPAATYSIQAQKEGYVAKFESGSVLINAAIEIIFELKPQVSENSSPTIPIQVAPADNAIDEPLKVALKWTATDPDDDTLKYEVILRSDANDNVQVFADILNPNYVLQNLNYATKYYWQVSVSDGINPKVLSEVRSFRTAIFPNARFLFTRKINSNNVIFVANDTGNELAISPLSANSYRPRKNNQANKIAFIKSDGAQEHIYTMNPDGSNVFKVTNSVPITGFNLDYINFSWSGNGSQIIYPYFDKLYKINADGSGLSQIYQTVGGKFISECDWSIDGSLIALKLNDVNGYNAEIIVINASGMFVKTVINGVNGAISGLHFSVNNEKLLFTRDITGFQSSDYRMLDSNIFLHNLVLNTTTQLNVGKLAGTNDLDVRFSPNEAEIFFVNTSNDGVSTRYIQKSGISVSTSRSTLYTNATMPDWK
ncbi:carboxypeptidase regulatory-like domain-containing protein [Flavobacterium sp.]|uniref:carboxypeptidase regulatory-like domain-containing protein n=1 Tax=Flavobacterium sp. TaxID=239 RepID=UPI00286DF325|nr:carboxypeptidase regulatory-like domain-containing protein [Flavobacterium sp.]